MQIDEGGYVEHFILVDYPAVGFRSVLRNFISGVILYLGNELFPFLFHKLVNLVVFGSCGRLFILVSKFEFLTALMLVI